MLPLARFEGASCLLCRHQTLSINLSHLISIALHKTAEVTAYGQYRSQAFWSNWTGVSRAKSAARWCATSIGIRVNGETPSSKRSFVLGGEAGGSSATVGSFMARLLCKVSRESDEGALVSSRLAGRVAADKEMPQNFTLLVGRQHKDGLVDNSPVLDTGKEM